MEEMSDDIADQVLAEIKESKFGFAIQLIGRINRYYQLLSITCLCPLCAGEYNKSYY